MWHNISETYPIGQKFKVEVCNRSMNDPSNFPHNRTKFTTRGSKLIEYPSYIIYIEELFTGP